MPLFNRRCSLLEVQNRALIKTARERAARMDELERELAVPGLVRVDRAQLDPDDRRAPETGISDSNSEMSAQIIPLKGRGNSGESSRIPATETVRVLRLRLQLGP
jgi:hypothetical protein